MVVLKDLLLGPPGRQRLRVEQSLLALVAYALCALLQWAEVGLGLIDPAACWWLASFYLGGALGFYGVIRSGLNERVTADPSLTMPQALLGIASFVGGYAITGPARGAVMTLLVLVLVFTMFSLRPAQSRGLALLAFVGLAAAMAWKSHTDPLRYVPVVEAVHLLFAAIVAGGVSILAGRMDVMRQRLRGQRSQLQEALERIGELAVRDELTGLYNRRHATTLLAAEQARQRRDGSPLVIAMLDIDLFKRINDVHGHQAGDEVLKGFAEAGRAALRSTDVLARWGGEEFLLILPGATIGQGDQFLQRMRDGLKARSFDAVAPGLRVTFSAGVGNCRVGDSIEACVKRADEAMYRAKQLGRDCSVAA